MTIAAKIIAVLGVVFGVLGTILVDRGTVAGAQVSGYMNQTMVADLLEKSSARTRKRRLGLAFIGLGFLLQGVSVLFS
jgi:hypothetical protein